MAACLLPVTFAILALAACETREVDSEGELVEPVETVSACEPIMFEETPLTHCTADPAIHAIRTVYANEDGTPYRGLATYAASRPPQATPVAFAINGGMFDEEGDPIGYYVEDGERLQGLNRAEGPGNFHLLPNGVFFGDASSDWHVWDTERFYDDVTRRPDFGTQSGPMLVIEGELHPKFDPDGESRKIRNGVGLARAGRAHFVISEAPVSFGKFARFFRDVLNTPNALFLDGTVSQLWNPANDRLDTGAPLGPLIVVEMRGNAQ